MIVLYHVKSHTALGDHAGKFLTDQILQARPATRRLTLPIPGPGPAPHRKPQGTASVKSERFLRVPCLLRAEGLMAEALSTAITRLYDDVGRRRVGIRRRPILSAGRPVQLVALRAFAMKDHRSFAAVQEPFADSSSALGANIQHVS